MDNNSMAASETLIQVVQLPIIEERLRYMKDLIDQEVNDALSLACTEETVKAVKEKRAFLRKTFDGLEIQRKSVKSAVMGPYNVFEAVYKECVADALTSADRALKGKIDEVETEQKRRCEDGLREYFAELCAVHHLDWLKFEQAGIKVDLSSAKQKNHGKLRKQLAEFVVKTNESVNLISSMEHADEIMVEFRDCLDATRAIGTVLERHRRMEEAAVQQEKRNSDVKADEETVKRVEALAPPVEVESDPDLFECSFKVLATMEQLRKLKKFLDEEGIKYE